MTRLTVELPDGLAESITLMAANRGYETPQMAVELMRASVSQREAKRERQALKSLSDEDVLALADLRLTSEQGERLHELLDLSSESKIDARQRRELEALMEVYDDALLRKAMGWAEASVASCGRQSPREQEADQRGPSAAGICRLRWLLRLLPCSPGACSRDLRDRAHSAHRTGPLKSKL